MRAVRAAIDEEDEPRIVGAEDEREVAGEHGEHHRQREVVVVDGPVLRFEQRGRVRLALLLHRVDELPVGRDDDEEDVRDHDRPEHHADLEIGRARGEQLACTPSSDADERRADQRERDLAPRADRAAKDVVDDPGQRHPTDAERDRLPLVERRDRGIDEADVRVEVVEDDHEREAREPRRVRLPLEPVQRLGHLRRGEPVLLRVVEAAAVHAPELTCDSRICVLPGLWRPEREIEADEVEGRADPGDPGDDVEHAQEDVEDVSQVRVHRLLAMATSSRQPVSSSSSRVFAIRPRSTSRISRFGRPSTKTTKRKPNFSS